MELADLLDDQTLRTAVDAGCTTTHDGDCAVWNATAMRAVLLARLAPLGAEREEAQRKAELRQRMIDIPTAWELTLATEKGQHHERCSYRTAGMLCDCAACRVMERVSGLLNAASARAEAAEACLARLAPLVAEREQVMAFLERQGYRRCDIPACNCNQWHGGHAGDRLREISDTLADAGTPGGTTIHGGVLMLRERAEAAEARARTLEQERDSLERESDGRQRVLYQKAEDLRQEWIRAENAEAERDALRVERDRLQGVIDALRARLVKELATWSTMRHKDGVSMACEHDCKARLEELDRLTAEAGRQG